MTSNGAKAAAIQVHVAGASDFDYALKIYNALGNTLGPVDDVLTAHNATRWQFLDNMDGEEFWESIEDCAISIDAARKHFKE